MIQVAPKMEKLREYRLKWLGWMRHGNMLAREKSAWDRGLCAALWLFSASRVGAKWPQGNDELELGRCT